MTTLPSQTENFGIYNPPVFTSRDPLFEQKPWLSPYHYCSNNPVKYVDPTGCDILPSKSFNESKYGNVYENLRSIGVYNKLVKPFERENIDLELQVSGTLNSDELGKTDRCSPVIQRDENDKIVGMCVKTDFGKEQMTQERGVVSLNWSGDAVWAIEEAAEVGVELKYIVPEEGSNVWFDGWVIPKYAQNVKAATWFINFMCRPDIAIRNMEETGYVSANGDISVLESQIDEDAEPIDVSYFFPGATSVRVDPALYPEKAMIERCALMHDWGNDTDKLISMWSRVKGESADYMTVIVIIAVIAVAVIAGIVARSKNRHKKSRKR